MDNFSNAPVKPLQVEAEKRLRKKNKKNLQKALIKIWKHFFSFKYKIADLEDKLPKLLMKNCDLFQNFSSWPPSFNFLWIPLMYDFALSSSDVCFWGRFTPSLAFTGEQISLFFTKFLALKLILISKNC